MKTFLIEASEKTGTTKKYIKADTAREAIDLYKSDYEARHNEKFTGNVEAKLQK
jgi:hypothetical protein